jgi:hypothetical protein
VVSAARPIRLVARADGGARTAGAVEDADRPQLALIRGYKDELAPIVAAYGEVEVFIRPATLIPPASRAFKPPMPQRWDDRDGWCALLVYADRVENRRRVMNRWAKAAGGDVHDGILRLPAGLLRGLALAELKTHARNIGIKVEIANAPRSASNERTS